MSFVIQSVTHDLSVYRFARIAYLQWDCSQLVHILLIVVPYILEFFLWALGVRDVPQVFSVI